MSVTTRDQLSEYVLRQLGAPLVNVEVHEDQMMDIIDMTVKEFTEFAYAGELEDTVILNVDGKGSYALPSGITSIIKVSQGATAELANFGGNYGKGLVPDMWSKEFFSSSTTGASGIINSIMGISATQSVIDKFMGDDLAYSFSPNKKILRLFEPYSGDILVHYSTEYIADAVDYIYDQQWIKKMCTAQARMIQSTITGKYDSALVGGARINYQDMRALAEQEIDKLREDLQLQWAGPAPILIG